MFRKRLIFLSHSGGDPRVGEVAVGLRARGYAVFFDGWRQTERWELAMKRAARRCRLFVFFVSPASVRSASACLNELARKTASSPSYRRISRT
jgi:hypothetical protein